MERYHIPPLVFDTPKHGERASLNLVVDKL